VRVLLSKKTQNSVSFTYRRLSNLTIQNIEHLWLSRLLYGDPFTIRGSRHQQIEYAAMKILSTRHTHGRDE